MEWKESYELGRKAELEFMAKLVLLWNVLEFRQPEGKFEEYDMEIKFRDCKTRFFEVKLDRLWVNSHMVWIEYEKKGKPTGICVTKADFVVYKLWDYFWCVNRSKLINLILNSVSRIDCQWWDDWTVKLRVISEEEFYSIAKKVDEPNENNDTSSTTVNNSVHNMAEVWV